MIFLYRGDLASGAIIAAVVERAKGLVIKRAIASGMAGDLTRDRNVTVIHAQFTRKDHIAKYVQYRMRPSFYTLHTYYFAEARFPQSFFDFIDTSRDADARR